MKKEDLCVLITFEGRQTKARLMAGLTALREASARCNPEDKFSMRAGAELAIARLFEKRKKYKEISRLAKPGEYVKICDLTDIGTETKLKLGKIYQVQKVENVANIIPITYIGSKNPLKAIPWVEGVLPHRYKVLEGYKP